jgi:CRISPR-associated protein Cas6
VTDPQNSLYWHEPEDQEQPHRSDTVVDVAFRIECTQLPSDPAYLLSEAVESLLPWFSEDESTGIHSIHGAESGNGWQRPEGVIHLSRRIRLVMRIPRVRVESCRSLVGETLEIATVPVKLGSIKIRELGPTSTLFARYLVSAVDEMEGTFLDRVNEQLAAMNANAPKRLPGRMNKINTPGGAVYARSLLLADLEAADSIRIQEYGLGKSRSLGCGLFIPHKSISAVHRPPDE